MNATELKARRNRLAKAMGKGSVALLFSAPVAHRNSDVEYPYRQKSDFLYLTGFSEPESVALICSDGRHAHFTLFCRENDPQRTIWIGACAGTQSAIRDFGADAAFPIEQLDAMLGSCLENRDRLFFNLGESDTNDRMVLAALQVLKSKARTGVAAPQEIIALDKPLHELRLLKSDHELEIMKKAAFISVAAHKKAMQSARVGLNERDIEATLLHTFFSHGSRDTAYSSIVASGINACTLHYVDNNQPLLDGDLLLIDAGVEVEGYASDITRTFPINGRFSKPQTSLYQLVLDAQMAAIETIRPGIAWNKPHDTAVRVLTEGLLSLGLLSGAPEKLIQSGAYKRFYMHRTGHWLGMDVHDVGAYKQGSRWRSFKAGMVLTVEPGLYIPVDAHDIEACWRGIGIRIEDDVLVTHEGCEVLTEALPKTITDIERLMAGHHHES